MLYDFWSLLKLGKVVARMISSLDAKFLCISISLSTCHSAILTALVYIF